MKKLVLIRHGKSNWDFPLGDHERPLKKRGISDAHLISDRLKKCLPKKFLIFSSTAKRTLDTAKIFAQNLIIPEELIISENELYIFDLKSLTKFIKSINNKHDSIILFGHNNAITDFVNKFGNKFIDKVPTSGAVFLQFEQNDWEFINEGKVIKTIFPKDLRNESKNT